MPYKDLKDQEYHRQYYQKNRDKIRLYEQKNKYKIRIRRKVWHDKNREYIKEKGKAWRRKNADRHRIYNRDYYWNHKDYRVKVGLQSKIRHSKLKLEILSHYSSDNLVCQHCGFSDIRALSIDHINGKGNIHRKRIGAVGGNIFYHWLKKNNFPSGYQVLCMNCQWKKRREEKECDHPKISKSKICNLIHDRIKRERDQQRQKRGSKKHCTVKKYTKEYYVKIYYKLLERSKISKDKIRKEVLHHYSPKLVCQKCSFNDIHMLTLDHIHGGGTKHIKDLGGGSALYWWLHKNYLKTGLWPEGYQVLCWNCQFIKVREKQEYWKGKIGAG